MIASDSLQVALDRYLLHKRLARRTQYIMRRSLAIFEEWLQRPSHISDLSDVVVSQWIQWMEERYAQRTVVGYRVNVMSLWRWLADFGVCDPPHRVRVVPRPDPCPISWTAEEIQRLLAQCGQLVGEFPGKVNRRIYCTGLVLFCYDTGLRRSDVWCIRWSQIRDDGTIVMRQSKTSRRHFPVIRPGTMAMIKQLARDPPVDCPYREVSAFYRFWKKHVTTPAGVRHGVLQQIRRTGATHLAIRHPEHVQRYLGHRTSEMQRHYVDESIARPRPMLPPEIDPPRPESP